jgi:hypothetical protein
MIFLYFLRVSGRAPSATEFSVRRRITDFPAGASAGSFKGNGTAAGGKAESTVIGSV